MGNLSAAAFPESAVWCDRLESRQGKIILDILDGMD